MHRIAFSLLLSFNLKGTRKLFRFPALVNWERHHQLIRQQLFKNLFDGDPKNLWKPAPGKKKAWVEVDLGEPINIGSFTVVEPWNPWDNHGQEFTLQYKNGDKWVDIISGKTNGCGHTQQFEPVNGRYFRLNIAGAKDGVPVLNEWVLNRSL